jgi:hypothetical protein
MLTRPTTIVLILIVGGLSEWVGRECCFCRHGSAHRRSEFWKGSPEYLKSRQAELTQLVRRDSWALCEAFEPTSHIHFAFAHALERLILGGPVCGRNAG